ncbi:glycosyltransferase family 9 protein [Telmatospirillum sp. J64-1]|uniref:glycosyltransferase family 9 protein n=1 Tax=Telmatospirillum sp. J64-1 TaxID=2502183 RepID=UPI00163D59A2|nr:glycosyltransferase family 9 protein [Telmatospirillum sp. J64-1]
MQRILVIKLGAFGDMIVALGPFQAVRRAHPDARITLLTTPPFESLGRACGLFDEVLPIGRAKGLRAWLHLVREMRRRDFQRVYDFQRNDRTRLLHALMTPGRRLEWSGVIKGASLYCPNTPDPPRQAFVRYCEQLAVAGIRDVPLPDISFLRADISGLGVNAPYVLLVPGASPKRPGKRAPAALYAAMGRRLLERGFTPVLVGTAAEADILREITAACPCALDLCGRTDFAALAELGRGASAALGNDTGPVHLLAVAGCPTFVLFSDASDPRECRPLGRKVEVLQHSPLADLREDDLWSAFAPLLPRP